MPSTTQGVWQRSTCCRSRSSHCSRASRQQAPQNALLTVGRVAQRPLGAACSPPPPLQPRCGALWPANPIQVSARRAAMPGRPAAPPGPAQRDRALTRCCRDPGERLCSVETTTKCTLPWLKEYQKGGLGSALGAATAAPADVPTAAAPAADAPAADAAAAMSEPGSGACCAAVAAAAARCRNAAASGPSVGFPCRPFLLPPILLLLFAAWAASASATPAVRLRDQYPRSDTSGIWKRLLSCTPHSPPESLPARCRGGGRGGVVGYGWARPGVGAG